MRIIQQFDLVNEKEFMDLEKKFDELEKGRDDFPKGKRMQPVSGSEPINTLIWQGEFKDIQSAYSALDLFSEDQDHEELFSKQGRLIKQIKIEFYKVLDFNNNSLPVN